ncbi:hypothetical protein BDN70DRAFT_38831 [Pholiota conissans]|uniref:NAD(P)-binding protein n=1 Tax=Pholiota conissans TaxID=109636 RepID=A0A9P5Z0S5_9AGAR|nr:hypothetical protein BDN70DRAFT_38831 [Pholiota conissans]
MASNSNLVAFIIGAGAHIGSAVASTLHDKGYRVALGSRSLPAAEQRKPEYLYVQLDAAKRGAIETAFDTVVDKLGPVNVVVYNAATVAAPPTPADVLSLPVDSYYDAANLGIGAFIAAQKALPSFKNEIHRNHPKAFITTGNLLPFTQYSKSEWFTLGIQKALETRFISTAVEHYKADDIRFYFATLVSNDGGIPPYSDFLKGAPTYAEVYWKLINNKEQTNWDHRFTLEGESFPHSTN